MTRTRRLILAVGVACVGTTVLLLAQANKPNWTARIGSPGEKALAITKPIVLTAEPWPKGATVAGTVMILHDRKETLRLPRDVKKLGLSSNDAVAMIGIYCDGDATADVVVSFQTSTRMFKPFFDVLPCLGKVIEKDDLIALWPRIEAFNKQTDEAKFLSALEFTRQKYDKSAADPVAAAIAYNALKFRSNFGLFDDVQVLKLDYGGNRIYAHSQGGGMDWRLWVFGRDGSFLGEVTCRKKYRDTALGIAQSMRTRVATRLTWGQVSGLVGQFTQIAAIPSNSPAQAQRATRQRKQQAYQAFISALRTADPSLPTDLKDYSGYVPLETHYLGQLGDDIARQIQQPQAP